jgi:hypothetical protein
VAAFFFQEDETSRPSIIGFLESDNRMMPKIWSGSSDNGVLFNMYIDALDIDKKSLNEDNLLRSALKTAILGWGDRPSSDVSSVPDMLSSRMVDLVLMSDKSGFGTPERFIFPVRRK